MSYFECSFCLQKFVTEGWFKKHECKLMKRHKVLQTNTGRAAYELYSQWIAELGYRSQDRDKFMESKYFVSFIKFVKFSNKMALPGKDKFIKLMVELTLAPKDWTSDLVYDHYMSQFTALFTPDEQAEITINTIFELARIYECDTDKVFYHMEPQSLIQLVQAQKLSPWCLLVSTQFSWFTRNEMTREQQIILQNFIEPEKWRTLFAEHPDMVDKMKTYNRALGI